MDGNTKPKSKWRRLKWTLGILGVFVVLIVGLVLLSARIYRGPQSIEAVKATMPGVPIFPFAELTANNRAQQSAMAIPLWMLRRQGATRADTAFLQVPADPDFIQEWHERAMTKLGWTIKLREQVGQNRRLIFVKQQAALQVIIGPQRDLLTAYQLVYLDGLSERLLTELR